MKSKILAVLVSGVGVLLPLSAVAVELWSARLVRVVDGDTAIMRVMPPDQKPFVQSVRFRGVDTPELKGLCRSERRAALRAKQATARVLAGGVIRLADPEPDHYGRLAARVLVNGRDVAETLVSGGYGRPYHHGRRQGWCTDAAVAVRWKQENP